MFPYLTVLQTHYSLNVPTYLFDLPIITHPATRLINLWVLKSNLLKPVDASVCRWARAIKNTNYAFGDLRAFQLLSQVCGITATQLYETIAVEKLVCCVWQTYDKYEACMRLYEGYDKYG